ncbi:MAG TPA: arsenite efflux transporter metallochaperone ArsD [Thermoanaerobaculia bacterium]|nr:arsenite efflux transporter metallochaperone ArsD [Thermoanaerobaculia bacterium]
MFRIEVFDPPLCCPTGVCGPVVDPVFPRFAGDLAWLAQNGVTVARHNLAQEPLSFTANEAVLEILKKSGSDALPVILVDGAVKSRGRYPSRDELGSWAGLGHEGHEAAPASRTLPTAACCRAGEGSDSCG